MYKFIFPALLLFLFSCTPQVTPEQVDQYETCKKTLIENKTTFIARGETKERQDSLAAYITDLEKNDLPELLQKYEVAQEQVTVFLFSICQNAETVEAK